MCFIELKFLLIASNIMTQILVNNNIIRRDSEPVLTGYQCPGCGSKYQYMIPNKPGYVPYPVLMNWVSEGLQVLQLGQSHLHHVFGLGCMAPDHLYFEGVIA